MSPTVDKFRGMLMQLVYRYCPPETREGFKADLDNLLFLFQHLFKDEVK